MNTLLLLESVLLFKNEPVSYTELSKILKVGKGEVEDGVKELQKFYKDRGLVVITDGESVSFGTHPSSSGLIEEIQKEELSRELGRAGIETLSIILYKGPISRREIDYIRGVNSGFIIRNLLIRGLIEKTESEVGERSFTYKATLKLLEYLGVSKKEDLPEYETAFKNLEKFVENQEKEEADE
jgi:segregation and condensation protein B